MRVILGLISLFAAAVAYDAVIFSNDQELSRNQPSLDALLAASSAEHPLVFLVEPDFTLGQFSRHASVYQKIDKLSTLAASVKSAKHATQRYLDVTLHVPSSAVITEAAQFKQGSSVYIVSADDWSSLEQLAETVLSKLSGYTAVITNTEAATNQETRVKRQMDLLNSEDAEAPPRAQQSDAAGVNGKQVTLPLTLPAYNRTSVAAPKATGCLMYLEGVSVVVSKKQGDVVSAFPSAGATISNGTFKADDANVKCSETASGSYEFTVSITGQSDVSGSNVDGIQFSVPVQPIEFKLTFVTDIQHYWSLASVELLSDFKVSKAKTEKKEGLITTDVTAKAGKARGVGYMGVNAVAGYSFNCGDTPAAWVNTSTPDIFIGISLHNFQVRLNGVNATSGHYFDLQVGDCVGTFSPGSLMGIITGLILVTVLLFGFLMLNSVQTMDRFDDPKQKQIVINVRE